MVRKTKNIKPHIGIFGRRNVGKSSLINFLTGQQIAIVSDLPGTTTDPVKKSVEIFGVGPAIVIDTAGIDDDGKLGKLRVAKSREVIPQIDMAILMLVANIFGEFEKSLIQSFKDYNVPFCVLHNKSEVEPLNADIQKQFAAKVLEVSLQTDEDTQPVIDLIEKTMPTTVFKQPSLFEDIVQPKDMVLLVTPIDSEAPEGRMILPQVMAWRHLLDKDCVCISVKETELEDFLRLGISPKLVITDSQVFDYVASVIPEHVSLTSFSILFARYKGNFEEYLAGAQHMSQLKDGDKVLILESCTHQVSCEDIGRVKIPNWLSDFSKSDLTYEVVGGFSEIQHSPDSYALVIQCGGCVVTPKQLQGRLQPFIEVGIPVTNYGMAIAVVNGIFDRVTAPFVVKK